jgi:hypothetical protein
LAKDLLIVYFAVVASNVSTCDNINKKSFIFSEVATAFLNNETLEHMNMTHFIRRMFKVNTFKVKYIVTTFHKTKRRKINNKMQE